MTKFYDRVRVTTTTTGTGTLTLGAAVDATVQSPAAAGAADGDVVPYLLRQGNDREWGYATLGSSGTTATRTVTQSIVGGVTGTSKINLSGAAATWEVVLIAADLSPLGIANGGTGGATASAARSGLGLVPGTDIQAYSALLAAIAGITFSQGDLIYHNGSTLVHLAAGTSGYFLKTQGAGANPIWAAGPSAKPFIIFKPNDNEPPSSNYATLNLRNGHPILEFDQTTQETAIFSGVMPSSYAGGGVTVSVFVAMAAGVTTGTVGFDAAIERINVSSQDIGSDSFASAQTITATTVPGTAGQILKLSVNITNGANMDSLAAGEAFRLRIRRDVANDTAAGDAQIIRVTFEEQ